VVGVDSPSSVAQVKLLVHAYQMRIARRWLQQYIKRSEGRVVLLVQTVAKPAEVIARDGARKFGRYAKTLQRSWPHYTISITLPC